MNYKYLLFILFGLYFFTRLYNLLLLPLFTDESIYIYWAKIIATTHAQIFISLTDGKPPLLIWLISTFLTIFPSEWYLLAGRLPSVIAGAISMLAIFGIGKKLGKSDMSGLLAALFYILFPFTLIYDKLALFDSLLSNMLLCSVYFCIRTVESRSYKHALLWGFFLGLAFLAKPTAALFLLLTPAVFLLLSEWEWLKTNIRKTILLLLVVIGVAEIINNLQRVSSVYFQAAIKNAQFQQPLEELLKNPFALTVGNLNGFFSWMTDYYTLPLFGCMLFSFIAVISWDARKGITLFALWFIPIIALASVGREIFPRYILFTAPYALLALSLFITQLLKRFNPVSVLTITFLVFLPVLRFDYYLLTDPSKAPFPSTDYQQLVSNHPSGYGLEKIYAYLDGEKAKGPIILVTQGTFGLYPYAFTLEYWNDPNITIIPRWPLSSLDQEILDLAQSKSVYVLLKEHDTIPVTLPLDLVLRSDKPGGLYPLLLTKIRIKN